MMSQYKREDFVVGFLVMFVIVGLMYQGFSFLTITQDNMQHMHFG